MTTTRTTFSLSSVLLAVLPLLCLMTITASADSAVGMGVVRGQVNYCGQGGVDGMQVYVPGRQLVVITAADGKFLFDQIPAGEYVFKFKLGERVFKYSSKVYVFQQRVNELGELAFCGAGVASGTLSAPVKVPESNKTPATTMSAPARPAKPVASGVCTEGTVVNISNGVAECTDGHLKLLSCSKGHGDCDGKIENGCEVDLMKDNDNCGSCGNACSMLETCALGSC